MFGRSDRDYFDLLWRRKLQDHSYSGEYIPGVNLRVDEALRTAIDVGRRYGYRDAELKKWFVEVLEEG